MSHPPASLSAAAATAAASSNGEESVDPRAAQLRSLILSACQSVEESDSSSNGHAGSSSGSSDWATLSALLDSCLSARLSVSDLLPVDTFQHLLSHWLLPAMGGGTDAAHRLLTTATVDLPALPSAADLSLLLQPALNAAALTLQLLCMPHVPRPLIREDYIEQVVTLVRSVLKKIVLPVYEAGAREKLLAGHANQAAAAAAQGRPPAEPSSWPHVEQQFRFLVPKTASLLSSLTRFLTLEKLPDRITHQLLELSYEVLGATLIGGAAADAALWHSLESACAQLVQKMFVQGGDILKRSVLDNLANTYRHLSPTRRHLRSYVVQQGNQRAVKKEEAAAGGATSGGSSMVAAAAAASAASSLDVAAIGSSIPLPAPLLPGHQPQVSIQLIFSLVLHLLQSLAAAPFLAEREAEDSVPLLERIQREVRAKEIADAAARPAETKKQANSGNKKKGSKKKVKASDAEVIDLANTDEDEPMSAGASSAAPPASSSAPSFFTSLHSSLDNPAVRNQFVSTLSAPMQNVRDYALYFLHKLFDRLQPPPKDSPLAASSTALSKKVSKQLLRLFIEDLLQVLFMPEFPVAEEMMFNTIKMIVANLNKKDRPVSEAFRLNCLSMLDVISLHLKLHLQIGEAHPIRIRPHKKLVEEERQQQQQQQAVQARESNMDDITEEGEALVESKEEELDCVCGTRGRYADLAALVKDANVRQWFLLDCDLCKSWFHADCLGFTEGNTPSEWKCSRCIIRKECENQMKELQRRRERLLSLKDSFTPSPAKRKGKGKGPASPNHVAASAAAALAQVEQELTPLADSDVTKVSSSVLRQLLINYMNAQVTQKEEEEMLYARQFDLCAWMQQAKTSEEKEAEEKEKEREKTKGAPPPSLSVSLAFQRELDICQLNWEPPLSAASASAGLSATPASAAASSSSSSAPLLISREVAINMCRQLCVDRPGSVLRLHSRLLDSLCAHCNDPAPQCRATAVAALAHMVRVDPTLLKEPKVKAALSRRADDSSITTREAVVELIGTHVLQAQAELNQQQQHVKVEDPAAAAAAASALSSKYTLDPEYLPFLLARLSDESVSIRKKVVRILRDLCLQSPPHPRYAELCERLILCVRDGEESMQSLSVTIVFEMWFDRTKETIKERKSKKVKVKLEEEGKTEGQLQVKEEEQDESAFSKDFQQLVQNIINVNHRLYASSNLSSGSLSDGAESLADIITLLLEQDAHLAKSSSSASGEMTSLTGLKMNLLKLSREQRKKQAKAAAEANQKPHHVSSLTQAFENADAAPKGRRKSGAAAAAASSSAAAAASTIAPSHPHSMPSICEDMVSCIVEKIVTQGRSGESTTASAANGSVTPSLLSCMQALHLFTQVQPALLLPHLETLRPYLDLASSPQQPAKPPAEQAAQRQALINNTACVTLQLDMLREVLPIIVTPTATMSKAASQAAASLASNTHFANKLFEPLHKILLSSPQTTLLKTVIPPLVLVCEKLLRSAEPLLKVFRAFITFLWIHQLPNQGAAIHPLHVVRSLIGIGLICKHFDVEAFLAQENAQLQAEGKPKQAFWSDIYSSVMSQPKVNLSQLQSKSMWMQRADQGKQPIIVERLFDLFRTHLKIADAARMEAAAKGNQAMAKQEANKQLSALQGIIALFSRKPTLISQSKEVMEICLNPSAPADLLRYSVRSLREFLEHEDRRVHQSQTKERAKAIKKKKKTKKGSGSSKKKGKQQQDSPEEEDEEQEEEEEEELEHESEGASFASPASSTAQSWVAATIDTADFLPTLVGMCEHHIYSLTYSPSPPIRYECLQFLRLVLQQGVTNPVDAMAPLVAALTDREPGVAKVARAIVTEVVGHKKELVRFLEQRFAEGIRCSFELQSKLYPKRFDPLHRTNLREGSPPAPSPPVYDNTPTDGLAKAYNLLQKSAATRKAFCKTFVMDLMNVSHIGVFAREAEEAESDEMEEINGTNGHNGFISPSKSLPSHPSLHTRSRSSDSIAGSPATPTKDLNEDFPAFVPPVLESPSFASPSSVQSSPSGASLFDVASSPFSSPASAPSSPLSYLSYLAGLCGGLPFEDDEPLHLSFHLSKVINTRGAALQANIQRTIVSLKKMAGESVQEEEEDEANLVAQKPEEVNGTDTQPISDLPADQESLLALLQLQCESAMAISILIRLRQWLQEAYDLSGRFEEWNIHASGTPASSSSSSTSPAHRGALKLNKKGGIPLHFNDLPLSEEQAQQLMATMQPGSNAASSQLASPLRVGARGSKAASHARHSSAPVYASSSHSSVIPLLCQAQSLYFHHSMERNAIFLAAKPSRRGHKRASTVGEWSGEDGSAAGSTDSTPVKKRRTSGQAKRRRRRMDSSDDTSEEEMEWEEEEESPRKSPAAVAGGRSGGRSRRSSRKPTRYQQISEEDEEDIRMEEEEEEAYEQNSEQAEEEEEEQSDDEDYA